MTDPNEMIQRLSAQMGKQQTLSQLQAALNTPAGTKAARVISAKHASALEHAAQAAQRGDMSEAAQLAQQLMQSQEGAQLAAQIKEIFHI